MDGAWFFVNSSEGESGLSGENVTCVSPIAVISAQGDHSTSATGIPTPSSRILMTPVGRM